MWSIAGQDKLEFWGIEIYVGVDACSSILRRFILAFTNRSVSVLCQYVDTLESGEASLSSSLGQRGGGN